MKCLNFVNRPVETDGGALTWLLSTIGIPEEPAKLHGYGTIIGTGNAICGVAC